MIKNIKSTDFILQFKNIYFICSSTSSPLPNKAELPTQNVSKETKRKLNGASAKFAACNCRLCPEQQQTCNVQQQKKKTKKKYTLPPYYPNTPTEKREKCQWQALNAKYYEHFLAALSQWPNRIRTAPCEKICAAKRLLNFLCITELKAFSKISGQLKWV